MMLPPPAAFLWALGLDGLIWIEHCMIGYRVVWCLPSGGRYTWRTLTCRGAERHFRTVIHYCRFATMGGIIRQKEV